MVARESMRPMYREYKNAMTLLQADERERQNAGLERMLEALRRERERRQVGSAKRIAQAKREAVEQEAVLWAIEEEEEQRKAKESAALLRESELQAAARRAEDEEIISNLKRRMVAHLDRAHDPISTVYMDAGQGRLPSPASVVQVDYGSVTATDVLVLASCGSHLSRPLAALRASMHCPFTSLDALFLSYQPVDFTRVPMLKSLLDLAPTPFLQLLASASQTAV
eukprot:NODE_2535_length_907_cov_103.434732_g2081_i0.p1 GENE.NODE_2535_length_907_cov_103.434732_g2081_i0~~NODE_2535_length_907_cov_103.434732_g2081_i0.p1  ORF type:complete len:225 (+),score=53.06 NODE_2535_length_907_cov_103.434732_g2081_i0:117-791(+)